MEPLYTDQTESHTKCFFFFFMLFDSIRRGLASDDVILLYRVIFYTRTVNYERRKILLLGRVTVTVMLCLCIGCILYTTFIQL